LVKQPKDQLTKLPTIAIGAHMQFKTTAFLVSYMILSAMPARWLCAEILQDRQVQAGNKGKTIWDGVYTPAQAARGKESYTAHCSACHATDLTGRNGPALRGDHFMDNWREDSLNSLYNRIKNSMPAGNPSSLADDTYLDVVAHILQVNAFPEGPEDLKPDALATIRVVGKEGPAPVPNFSLVQVVGCLAQGSDNSWILTDASDPSRTRNPKESTESELKSSAATPLGAQTFRLLDVDYFRPDFTAAAHKGHKMEAKGFLIRNPADLRLSITWLEMLDSSCTK
jgi:mono/diheme cytochrome c family protein